ADGAAILVITVAIGAPPAVLFHFGIARDIQAEAALSHNIELILRRGRGKDLAVFGADAHQHPGYVFGRKVPARRAATERIVAPVISLLGSRIEIRERIV